MKKIAIFTTSRAEFGIFTSFIRALEKEKDLGYSLFVGGAHISKKYGNTVKEIKDQGFIITDTFDYLQGDESAFSLAKSTGIETVELARIFNTHPLDFVCILGDRYELLPIVLTAILFKKPILHLSGGEITEGVIDDQIRHMVTKASHIHFASCDEYALNIIKMGEPDWRVHNTGELAIDNLANTARMSKEAIFSELNLNVNKECVICSYHPVSLEYSVSPLAQIENLFAALNQFDFQVVISAPNVEVDREVIISFITRQVQGNPDYKYVESLGVVRFHSLLAQCRCIIGNSSSGITEAPFLRVPSINIGDRQKGRLRHVSVIDTDYTTESIVDALHRCATPEFASAIKSMRFLFGDGTASKKMIDVIRNTNIDQRLIRKVLSFPQ